MNSPVGQPGEEGTPVKNCCLGQKEHRLSTIELKISFIAISRFECVPEKQLQLQK